MHDPEAAVSADLNTYIQLEAAITATAAQVGREEELASAAQAKARDEAQATLRRPRNGGRRQVDAIGQVVQQQHDIALGGALLDIFEPPSVGERHLSPAYQEEQHSARYEDRYGPGIDPYED